MDSYILIQEQPRGASQTVEIPIAAASADINFPDIPELRSDAEFRVIIKGIRHITNKVLTNGPVTGVVNTPRVDMVKISLQLYSEGWLRGYNIPLLTLNDMADADSAVATTIPYRTKATRFDDWQISWNKSKVHFSPGTTAAGASVLVLEIEYERYRLSNGSWVLVTGPA
jgi:hypothetical protein